MTKEEFQKIEEEYEQAIRGLPGRYMQCIRCGNEGQSRGTLSHQPHCPWGHISALLAHCKALEAEVERLEQYESVAMAAEADKVINDTRAHLRGEITDD